MKPKEFLEQLDEQRIVDAITAAERATSGEIRVYVSHKPRQEVMAAAERRFVKLGMTKTRHRNAVLIYFAPVVRKFAILGDAGVHEKCGEDFWKETSAVMSEQLRQGRFTDAILAAVVRVGELLARHFPPEAGDRNELPNEIAHD
jgi:uncharacterized membrane protein